MKCGQILYAVLLNVTIGRSAVAAVLADVPPASNYRPYQLKKHVHVTAGRAANIDRIIPSPDHPQLAFVNSGDSSVRLVNLCTGQAIWQFQRPGLDTYIPIMEVSPDGKYVVTNDPLARIFVVNGSTGALIKNFRFQEQGWTLLPGAAGFSPTSQYLYVEYDGEINVFSGPNFAAPLQKYKANLANDVRNIAVRSNGDVAVLSGQGGFVRWKANQFDKPEVKLDLPMGQPFPRSKSWSFADRWFAMTPSNRDQNIYLLGLNRGESVQTFSGHSTWITGFSMSQDLQLSYSTSYDGTLKIWETKTGRILQDLATVDSSNDQIAPTDVNVLKGNDRVVLVGTSKGEIAIYAQGNDFTKICGASFRATH